VGWKLTCVQIVFVLFLILILGAFRKIRETRTRKDEDDF
jgi:hypothetical protein